jgi:hypothetical protein
MELKQPWAEKGRRWNCLRERIYFISTNLGSGTIEGEKDTEEDYGDGSSSIKTGPSPRGDTDPGNLQVLATNYWVGAHSQPSPANSPMTGGRGQPNLTGRG